MPTVPNIFQYQQQSPLADAFSNFAKSFVAASSPQAQFNAQYRQALIEQARATAALARMKIDTASREANAGNVFADVARRLAQNSLAAMDPAMAAGADAGSAAWMDPQQRFASVAPDISRAWADAGAKGDLGDVFRSHLALIPDAGDVMADRMLAASGSPLTEAQAKGRQFGRMTPADQRIAALGQPAYGATESQEKGRAFAALPADRQSIAVGPTYDEARGHFFNKYFERPDELSDPQLKGLGMEPAREPVRTPRMYRTPDGKQGTTLDGLTDAQTGARLPQGTIPVTGRVTEMGTLQPSVVADEQKRELAAQRFERQLAHVRQLAEANPNNFGLPGLFKGAAQDVQILVEGLARATGYKTPAEAVSFARRELLNSKDFTRPDLLPGLFEFDPSLPSLQTAADMLIFAAASSLAAQDNRSISDKDVVIFRNAIGDPTSPLMSQQKFLAKLQTAKEILDAQRGKSAAPGSTPPAAAPTPPADAPVQRWERGPDGRPRRVQ